MNYKNYFKERLFEQLSLSEAETGVFTDEHANLDEAYEAKLNRIRNSIERAEKRGDKEKAKKLKSEYQKLADTAGPTKRTRRLEKIADTYDPARFQKDNYRTQTGARASMGLKRRFDPKFGERMADTDSAYRNVRYNTGNY